MNTQYNDACRRRVGTKLQRGIIAQSVVTPLHSEIAEVERQRIPVDSADHGIAGHEAVNASALVDFLTSLRFEALPADVVNVAKLILLDTIGCMVGGTRTEPGRIAISAIEQIAGIGHATVPTRYRTFDPVSATYLNALLSDVLDFEDTLIGHPSATVVPAALAFSEVFEISGKQLITAITAGYEISLRIAEAIRPSVATAEKIASWYHWQAFGACSAAGMIAALSHEQFLDAFGYAGSSSPLPVWVTKFGWPTHWLKNNYAEQARAGALGVIMARAGYLAPRRLLDHNLGFWRMVGSDKFDPMPITRGLGREWITLQTTFKPYPACRYIHPTLDAASEILASNAIKPDEIDRIIVSSFSEMVRWFTNTRPAHLVDAEFSVPITVSLLVHGVPVGPDWYTAETLARVDIRQLADRVELVEDQATSEAFWNNRTYSSTVEIVLKNGSQFSARVDDPRGSTSNPMSYDELRNKFTRLCEPAFGPSRTNDLADLISHLEEDVTAIDLGKALHSCP